VGQAYVARELQDSNAFTIANEDVLDLWVKLVTVMTLMAASTLLSWKGQLFRRPVYRYFNMLAVASRNPYFDWLSMDQFQQTGVSVQRLGDILNSQLSLSAARSALPPIQGQVEFDRFISATGTDGSSLRGVSLTMMSR